MHAPHFCGSDPLSHIGAMSACMYFSNINTNEDAYWVGFWSIALVYCYDKWNAYVVRISSNIKKIL